MADIRKRTGKNGTTYQVRYADATSKTGYNYATFSTMKEARAFREDSGARLKNSTGRLESVEDAIQIWLNKCEYEGRDGKDPVSPATLEGYKYRAEIMRAYTWDTPVSALKAPDIVAFRSWLLQNHSRDLAKKVLSSFHSVLLEMVSQGILATDPAARISIQQSRYKGAVRIPSVHQARAILRAADDLASHQNQSIAKAWQRYRAMIYLAADTGMRPQEYLALNVSGLMTRGVQITQALDRSDRIGPPKSRAGRRYIPVGDDTLKLVRRYLKSTGRAQGSELVFAGAHGKHQPYNGFLRRGWHTLMEEAGLVEEIEGDNGIETSPLFTPYALRHFYASMLIAQNKDLKTIQERMGHEDAAMTLNVYGHLIRMKEAERIHEPHGVVSSVLEI